MDADERIQAASKFLMQSPPGEINDVLNGTRTSCSDITLTHAICYRRAQYHFG